MYATPHKSLNRMRNELAFHQYVDFYDSDHSFDGHRYIIIEELQQRRLLIVSNTERDDVTRLISAREVARSERETYEEG